MQLVCDLSIAACYKSQAQISRVLSEKWLRENGYCLACDSSKLLPTPANTKASDFACSECGLSYELKAFRSKPAVRLVDGAYRSLISRIQSGAAPTLMLLQRNEKWHIRELTAVHHQFLTPEVIEERRPLSPTARRAGWIGCNIRLDRIGEDALISVIRDGVPCEKDAVQKRFRQFEVLGTVPVELRGWSTFTLRIIRGLKQPEFLLDDVYQREHLFKARYPNNRNVRAKVRQQLQVLRDLGLLEFLSRGKYRLLI
jgi:type II restriction enzyme